MVKANEHALSACEYFWEVHVPAILDVGKDTMMPTLSCTVEFRIQGDGGGVWVVSVRDGLVDRISRGASEEVSARVTIPVSAFLDIARGLVDHKQAFFEGLVQVDGDVGLVLQASGMIPILRERFPFRTPETREVCS